MDGKHLSKRLVAVAAMVPKGSVMADIGSDHGYLPVNLLVNQQIKRAIAVEVVQGPFENTKAEIEKMALTDLITVRLADGLAGIELSDQIDTVVLAGMGGTLITEILSTGLAKLVTVKTLILQPNVGEYQVREWLGQHGFVIKAESIVAEDGHIYEMMRAEKRQTPVEYDERDLAFGPILRKTKPPVFVQKWKNQAHKQRTVLAQLKQSKQDQAVNINKQQRRLTAIEEVLADDNR